MGGIQIFRWLLEMSVLLHMEQVVELKVYTRKSLLLDQAFSSCTGFTPKAAGAVQADKQDMLLSCIWCSQAFCH